MKKIIALTLTGLLLLGGSATVIASAEAYEPEQTAQADLVSAQNNLYLVAGTYVADGNKVENVIPSGATKLNEQQCVAIHTDNVYLCSLAAGEKLPQPESVRVDKDGNPYSFNGWWSIVDATVTYFDTVPEISETTFLYADWRADLSQRRDPVEVDDSTAVQPKYYMSIERAASGKTEQVTLYVSGTDSSSALQFGYGAPVQFYNEWFELNSGDKITVYTTGLDSSDEPQVSPITVPGGKASEITLEKSSLENNDTSDYLSVTRGSNTITYTAEASKHYRIYIKFYDEGATMTVYMQPQE